MGSQWFTSKDKALRHYTNNGGEVRISVQAALPLVKSKDAVMGIAEEHGAEASETLSLAQLAISIHYRFYV